MDSENIFLKFIGSISDITKKPILAIVAFVMYFIFSVTVAIKGKDMAKLKEEYEKEKDKEKNQTGVEKQENKSDDWVRNQLNRKKKQ